MKNKKIFINGVPLDEPYVHFLEPPSTETDVHEITSIDVRERYGPITVPPNQYFVMGDNRDNSQDSRYWGFLQRDYIKGKALLIYWSYEAEREDYETEGPGATLRGLGSVFAHFFTRTRWDRMLHQIR
jgi:signal peptidase I